MEIEQNQMAKIQALLPLRGSIGVKLESTHPVGKSSLGEPAGPGQFQVLTLNIWEPTNQLHRTMRESHP